MASPYWRIKAVLIFGLCATATAHAGETVTIGAEDDWAPYSSSKAGAPATGFAVDIVHEAYKAAGVDVKFATIPFARCLNDVAKGLLVGCFDTVRTKKTGAEYRFHDKPLFNEKSLIFALKDSTESGLTSQSLEGKTVGVTLAYEYGEAFDTNTKIKRDEAATDTLGFKKLIAGRYKYFISFERVAKALFAENKAFQDKFKPVGVASDSDYYIAFSRKHPDSEKFLEKFNQGMEIILKNGTYKSLEARW